MGWSDAPVVDSKKPAWASAPEHDGDSGPAPRWDFAGDIGRAAEASASAMEGDFHNAFPSLKDRHAQERANFQEHGFWGGLLHNEMGSGGRMLSLAKLPLDALGIITAPFTGAVHAAAGSALSYAVPTPSHDVTIAGHTYFSDPKKAADQIIDESMMAIGPRGMGTGDALVTASQDAAAANAARKAATLKNRAIAKVNERATADRLTPQQVKDAQQAASANGDKVTLMDLGDKNVRGLAGAVYRAPGPAGKEIDTFLKSRDAAATPNLTKDIQGSVGNGSTYSASQDLLNARSAAARPAYDAVESIGPVHSDRLQEFMGDPEIQAGLKRGLKLERQNARAENRPFKDSDYAVTGYKDGNLDEPIFDKVPTMKSLIVANEGLGAQIADMVNPATGRITKDGLALKKYRDAFQSELDDLSGGKYKAARDTWSGPAQSMEALSDGRAHFTRSESNEQLKAEFDALSPGDKDFYRMGAAEAKVDQLERAPDASDKSKRVINSERDRKRFSMLFDSPAQAQQFIDSVARKRQAFETQQAVKGNSATAGRIAEDADHAGGTMFKAAGGLMSAAGGNLFHAAKAAYEVKRDLGLRNNPEFNSEIAKLLMDHNIPVGDMSQSLIPPVPVPAKKNSVASAAIVQALLRPPKGSPQAKH